VGKSTLFNRLVGGRRAIVTDEPGVTRDRLHGTVDDTEPPFELVDTGGLLPGARHVPFAEEIERQAETALRGAALTLFVVDGRAGPSGTDLELAARLRRRDLPLILVLNKVDGPRQEAQAAEATALGLGDPVPVSAEHGLGLAELVDAIEQALAHLPADRHAEEGAENAEAADEGVRVAVVGRPNVGKSSLVNRLLGEERVVVSEIPGTTRDAIDTRLVLGDRRYVLIDTAGIRRRGKLQLRVERTSVARARQNIERCDVAVLVLDGSREFAAQDAHVAGHVRDALKPMVVAVNKWDLVAEREEAAKRWRERIRSRLKFAKETPLVLVSAVSGQRVTRILDEVDALHAQAGIRVPTTQVNRWLEQVAGPNMARPAGGDGLRVYYATQTGVRPPTFVLFCNDPRRVHFSFRRRLENTLRERFGFGGAPIRLQFRARRA
jgi:GTP-binding protein